MTIAFIVSLVISGILFVMWVTGRDSLTKAENQITRLSDRIDSLRYRSNDCVERNTQTPLTDQNIRNVITNNGFIPLSHEEPWWIPFKCHDQVCFVSTGSLPLVQFYKGFSYKEEDNLEILNKAAEKATNELLYGRITVNEEEKVIAFRIFVVEKNVEHFADSFMEYMKMLEDLTCCFRYYYDKLLKESDTYNLNDRQIADINRKQGAVS